MYIRNIRRLLKDKTTVYFIFYPKSRVYPYVEYVKQHSRIRPSRNDIYFFRQNIIL